MRVFTVLLSYVAALVACCSCNNDSASAGKPLKLKGNWYKHFTGTIAGVPVAVDISCYNRKTEGKEQLVCFGTYSYSGKSELINIQFERDSAGRGWLFSEQVMTERDDEGKNGPRNKWLVQGHDNIISGWFYKAGSKDSSAIELKEDYTDAFRFDLLIADDSIVTGKRWQARASWSFIGVVPDRKVDKALRTLLDTALLSVVGRDSVINSIYEYPRLSGKRYLKDFKESMDELEKDSTEGEPISGYENYHSLFPVYNANGLTVIGDAFYDYSGGAHGMYGSSYVNVDIRQQKILTLADIMIVDSTAISLALNESARRSFKIKAGRKLSDVLFEDEIPATDNFIVSDKGLTFCYNPYEIASFAAGEVLLFVPFSRIKNLLKPAFAKRMGLQ